MITASEAQDLVDAAKLAPHHVAGIDRNIRAKATAGWSSPAEYTMPADGQEKIADVLRSLYEAAGWQVSIVCKTGSDLPTLVFTLPPVVCSAKER